MRLRSQLPRTAPLGSRPGFIVAAIGWLAALLLRAVGATWRIRLEGDNPLDDRGLDGHAKIGALWHRNILTAAYCFRDSGFVIGVSASRDGDLISTVLRGLGYAPPARGSSSRGGAAALRGLVRAARRGTTVAVVADGPRGPARCTKAGVAELARLADVPITPVCLTARPAWHFGSWDGTLLPLPFARVVCSFGASLSMPKNGTRADLEVVCRQLDEVLNGTTDELDARLGVIDARRPEAGC